jgi:hypothetical protein
MNAMSRTIAMLACLLLASPAQGQETSPSQPERLSADEEAPTKDEEKRDQRFFTLGLGPSLVFWPPGPDDESGDVAPSIAVETRNVFLTSGRYIGWEWTNDVVFHDFQAMGDAYDWYFREPEEGGLSQGVKLGLLWPGLILIPFGGANYTTGGGLIVYTSPSAPAAFFDVGAQLNLFLRLSDPDFKADFSIGAYGGGGYEINDFLSVSARLNWGTPLIHNIQNDTAGSIWTMLVTTNLAF